MNNSTKRKNVGNVSEPQVTLLELKGFISSIFFYWGRGYWEFINFYHINIASHSCIFFIKVSIFSFRNNSQIFPAGLQLEQVLDGWPILNYHLPDYRILQLDIHTH